MAQYPATFFINKVNLNLTRGLIDDELRVGVAIKMRLTMLQVSVSRHIK